MTDVNESIRTVAVFGATGKVGKLFVQEALNAGHHIRAFVRNPAKLEPQDHPRIEAVVGDAAKLEDVAKAMADVDVVVSCLGNVGGHYILRESFDNSYQLRHHSLRYHDACSLPASGVVVLRGW